MALPQTFTGTVDTELNALDQKWVKNVNYTGFLELDGAGRYRAADANSSCYKYNEAPPSADYSVKQDVYFPNTTSPALAVCGRMHTSDNTMYFFRWNSGLQLYKINSGTATQLGSTVAQTVNAGETHEIKIQFIGSTIKGFFNGVEKISVTDTSISAAGFGGIRSNAGLTALGDNFSIPELESSGAIVSTSATITAPAFSGSISISPVVSAAVTIAAPVFSGSISSGNFTFSFAATISAPAFSGSVSVTPIVTISAVISAPAFSGSISVTATITITDLEDLTTGTLRVSETGITAIINLMTGELVAVLTGQTSTAGGDMSLAHPAFVSGSWYRVTTVLADGSEGTWKYQAA